MPLKRASYLKLLLATVILVLVNVLSMPFIGDVITSVELRLEGWPPGTFVNGRDGISLPENFDVRGEGTIEENIVLELHPRSPYNAFYMNSDTTITICIRNLTNEENEYYSVAMIALDNAKSGYIEFTLVNPENENNTLTQRLFMQKLTPQLSSENLAQRIAKYGLPENALRLCIPRYRRYWHPELNEEGDAVLGYVWLLAGPENNVLIDDNGGNPFKENLILPQEIEAADFGEARVWNGMSFENVRVPTVRVTGDNDFDYERFELYYANWDNRPAWVSRRSFYWENIARAGLGDEVPDVERIELWISAENGERHFTISDFHFVAFRDDEVESYELYGGVHSPIPEGRSQVWHSIYANYKNVYPMSDISFGQEGFEPYQHPITRETLERRPLIQRNLIGLGLASLVFLIPATWQKFSIRKKRRRRWI